MNIPDEYGDVCDVVCGEGEGEGEGEGVLLHYALILAWSRQ